MRRECRTLSAVRQSGAGGLAAGQAALDNPAQPQKKKKYIVSIPITKVSARYRYTHTHTHPARHVSRIVVDQIVFFIR